MTSFFPKFLRRSTGLILVLALALPLTAAEEKQHYPSEKAAEAFGKLQPLMDKKDWAGMHAILDAIPIAAPDSYDRVLILDMKAKIYMNQEQYAKAIEPLETSLKVAEGKGYFKEEQLLQNINILARLIYSEALNLKGAQQTQMIQRAAGYLKRFLAGTKKPNPDDTMFYAQLLYAQATADENNINLEMIREARKVVEDGMRMSISPREGFYQILVALVLQENDYKRSAELLELVVDKFPAKKDFWPQLMLAYIQLATNEKDETKARDYYIRAINTVERGQNLGLLNDPKNNYNLVTFYIAVGQYSKATDLLHAGLRKGTIESTVANWRVLGSYYQQADREQDAIIALQEATKLFPKDGMIELHLGEIYRGLEKTKEAREAYRRAVQKKDTLEKPHVAYQLLAYAAMEFDDWDEALMAIREASKYPDFEKDDQMKRLKQHIEQTVREREEAAKAAAEAKAAANKKV